MAHSTVKKKRAKMVLHQWKYRQAEELEQKKRDFAEEQRRFHEERRKFERERRTYVTQKKFDEERTRQEKQFFEMKWKLLEEELRKLSDEKAKFKKQKAFYQFVREQEMQAPKAGAEIIPGDMFFIGVTSRQALKKRYKELIKIYHPDNLGGDTETIQEINREYEKLKKLYS